MANTSPFLDGNIGRCLVIMSAMLVQVKEEQFVQIGRASEVIRGVVRNVTVFVMNRFATPTTTVATGRMS